MDNKLIAGNLAKVVARIQKKCDANGLDFSNVKLVGVSKTATAARANEAVLAGLKELGENRVQEGIAKSESGIAKTSMAFYRPSPAQQSQKSGRVF